MLRNGHVRFGGRAAETHQPQDWQGAAVRPLHPAPHRQGWVYCAAVLDVYSLRIVGWSIADHPRTELVVDAIEVARWRRRPIGTIIHSDRGVPTVRRAGLHAQTGRPTAAGVRGSMKPTAGPGPQNGSPFTIFISDQVLRSIGPT